MRRFRRSNKIITIKKTRNKSKNKIKTTRSRISKRNMMRLITQSNKSKMTRLMPTINSWN